MPSISHSHAPLKPLEKVMIFIDGGYLRKLFNDLFKDDDIDFLALKRDLLKWYNTIPTNLFRANLVRTYYYDGIVNEKDEEFEQQSEYFELLKKRNFFLDVVLGEAVRSSDGTLRQKGVDILMAIDALTMASGDHYDSGFFLLGDRDFIPLVRAVKDLGKKTFGFFYMEDVSMELKLTFDFRTAFNERLMKKWLIKNQKTS